MKQTRELLSRFYVLPKFGVVFLKKALFHIPEKRAGNAVESRSLPMTDPYLFKI